MYSGPESHSPIDGGIYMEKQDREHGNRHVKWKQTWKMENLSREMLIFLFLFQVFFFKGPTN